MYDLSEDDLLARTSVVDMAVDAAVNTIARESLARGYDEENMLFAFCVKLNALTARALAHGEPFNTMRTLNKIYETSWEYMESAAKDDRKET